MYPFLFYCVKSIPQIVYDIIDMLCANGKPDGIGFNSLIFQFLDRKSVV